MTERVHTEAWPPVRGVPGLVQGRYGVAGNLELVAPADDDGLWVGWFNADPEDARAGAVRLRWSGALRFAHGRRYRQATIAQVAAGDGALEVLAVDDGDHLVRHVWTAQDGFRDHGAVRERVRATSSVIVAPDGSHVAVVADLGGQVHRLQGRVDEYPSWRPTASALGVRAEQVAAAAHDDHLDVLRLEAGDVVLDCGSSGATRLGAGRGAVLVVDGAGRRWAWLDDPATAGTRLTDGAVSLPLPTAEALALAISRVDGVDGVDVVARTSTGMTHLRVTGQPPAVGRSAPVRAEVWVTDPAPSTLHR